MTMKNNLRSPLICAALILLPSIVLGLLVAMPLLSSYDMKGYAITSIWIIQPAIVLIGGLITGLTRYRLWFVFPIFAGLVHACMPIIMSGGNAPIEGIFFLISFVLSLIGMGAGFALNALYRRIKPPNSTKSPS
jgi:hypothetical protein